MTKIRLCFLISLLMTASTAFAFWGSFYPVTLSFVNCTNQEIKLSNEMTPYKFSLDPNIPANNDFSVPYSLVIPPSSVFNYPHLSVYFNSYVDGAMHLNFSGGVTGHALLGQISDRRNAYCWCWGERCSCTGYTYVEMITTSSDSPDITFLSPAQVLDTQRPQANHVVISLGCKIKRA